MRPKSVDEFKSSGENRIDNLILKLMKQPVNIFSNRRIGEVRLKNIFERCSLDIIGESRRGEMVNFSHTFPELSVKSLGVDKYSVEIKKGCFLHIVERR